MPVLSSLFFNTYDKYSINFSVKQKKKKKKVLRKEQFLNSRRLNILTFSHPATKTTLNVRIAIVIT